MKIPKGFSVETARFVPKVLAFSLVFASYAHGDLDDVYTRFQPENPKVVESGNQLYLENCAACHGKDLEGQKNWRERNNEGRLPAPPHDETGHTWHHDDDALFEIVKYGVGKLINDPSYETDMPFYEDVLSDDEIINIMSFIVSTWPEKYQTIQADRTKSSETYFHANKGQGADAKSD